MIDKVITKKIGKKTYTFILHRKDLHDVLMEKDSTIIPSIKPFKPKEKSE